ncbi:MAG: AAA family ATP:ADP antiporter [Saprospiraceae bacterium]
MKTIKLNQAISFFLRKTFDIREGELNRALLMQFNIFLIISTLLIVKPTVNALFLSKFGIEQLPYAFLLVALVAGIVSTLYSRMINKIAMSKLMVGTLYGSVVSLILFGFFLRMNILEGAILYLFYVWVAIFALLATSQFWVLANIVFNAREAKRLFGFVGAGAIAGGIFGGYLTSVLAQFMSSEFLPFICAVFLAICIPVTRRIWKREVKETQTDFQQKKKTKTVSIHPFKQILRSKHLTYIAIIVGVSVIIAKLVDYQFGGIASSIIQDPDELTAFFGFWFSTFNVISLLIQLFVTRKLVGTFGVGSSLFLLPGSILVAVVLLLIMPELLLAAIFLKMADGGLKQSVNKAAMELLILPIAQEVKNQTKTFIDVFIDSLATGISGLMLIFLVKGLDLSTVAINILILILILIWIYFAYQVRGEYFKTFRQKIDFTKEPKKRFIDIRNTSVIGGMKKVLEEGSEKQILFILQKIQEQPDDRFFDSIQNLINHPSDLIRSEAIRSLYFFRKYKLIEKIEPMVNDPSQKVKIAVFEYLLTHGSVDRIPLINSYLQHTDYQIKYAALVSLAKETHLNPEMKSLFHLEQWILENLKKVPLIPDERQRIFCTLGLLKAIGYSGITSLYPYLRQYMFSDNMEYSRQAIKSAGDTMHPQFLDELIDLLGNDNLRLPAQQALVHYGRGIVAVLITAAKESDINLKILRIIPSVVKQINTQKAVDFLFELQDYDDLMVRQEALRGLNSLRNKNPHLSFSKKTVLHRILSEAKKFQETLSVLYTQTNLDLQLGKEDLATQKESEIKEARARLVSLLENRLDRNLERIFRLLGLKYNSADIVSIYRGLHSDLPDLRLNAIEFLDNLLEPGLKKILIPIIETAMLETISEEAIRNLNIDIPSEFECLRYLLNNSDPKVKQLVARLIEKLDNPELISLLV